MTYRIFIGFASGDDVYVKNLSICLSRLEGMEVFVPDLFQTSYKMHCEIKKGLEGASAVIMIITFNSTDTVWLNQEIGYASAKNIPIILVAEKGTDPKGFVEGQEFIIYQRGNFNQNIYQIISKLRKLLPHLSSGKSVKNYHVTCPMCQKEFLENLPSQNEIDGKVQEGKYLELKCKYCMKIIHIDPSTLSVIE